MTTLADLPLHALMEAVGLLRDRDYERHPNQEFRN
jgi:hypothetical protein